MENQLKSQFLQALVIFSSIWIFFDFVTDIVISVYYRNTCTQNMKGFELDGLLCGYFYASVLALVLPAFFAIITNYL